MTVRKHILAFVALVISAISVHAQEEWSIPVSYSGTNPDITDFVSAFFMDPAYGDSLGDMIENWHRFKRGESLSAGARYTVDIKNGYVCFETVDNSEDGIVWKTAVEWCYWNCSDGKHKLIAENIVSFKNGVPYEGQFSGIMFHLYDNKKKNIVQIWPRDIDAEIEHPAGTEAVECKLPRIGKTMEYIFHTGKGQTVTKKLTWNGSKFIAL